MVVAALEDQPQTGTANYLRRTTTSSNGDISTTTTTTTTTTTATASWAREDVLLVSIPATRQNDRSLFQKDERVCDTIQNDHESSNFIRSCARNGNQMVEGFQVQIEVTRIQNTTSLKDVILALDDMTNPGLSLYVAGCEQESLEFMYSNQGRQSSDGDVGRRRRRMEEPMLVSTLQQILNTIQDVEFASFEEQGMYGY